MITPNTVHIREAALVGCWLMGPEVKREFVWAR
jgi:hypothetical protein